MSAALSLQPSYYEALKRLTLELAGVRLGEHHTFLIETRLGALARKEGFENLPDMIDELFSRGQTRLAVNVVSALIERDLRFFDDRSAFEQLEDHIIPQLMPLYKGQSLRILSFACGSGQDAVSTAMVMDKLSEGFPDLDYNILAVDYPCQSLERAKKGRYTHFEVQRGLPIKHLVRYFNRDGEDWVLKETLQRKINFKDFHLIGKMEPLGRFHIVLFRNMLGRYTPTTKLRLLRGLAQIILPRGYLILGSGENLQGLNFGLESCLDRPGIFLKQNQSPQIDQLSEAS